MTPSVSQVVVWDEEGITNWTRLGGKGGVIYWGTVQ